MPSNELKNPYGLSDAQYKFLCEQGICKEQPQSSEKPFITKETGQALIAMTKEVASKRVPARHASPALKVVPKKVVLKGEANPKEAKTAPATKEPDKQESQGVEITPEGLRNGIEEIARFIESYVFLKNRTQYLLLALWTASTALVDNFEYTGYLYIHSPEAKSGKSRLLEVLDSFAYNSSGVLINPSDAGIFRTATNHTQLFDEVDQWYQGTSILGLLNGGFHQGAFVSRQAKILNGDYEDRKFAIYAPRAFAGISAKLFNDTTRSRMFKIELLKKTKKEVVLRWDRRARTKARIGHDWIRRLHDSRAMNDAISAKYEEPYFSYVENFSDRTVDVVQPIAAILEVAYAGDPSLEYRRGELVEAIALTRDEEKELARDHILLRVFADIGAEIVGNLTELHDLGRKYLDDLNTWEVKAFLEKYRFDQKSVRKDGEARKRYVLPLEKLRDLLTRYGSA